MTVPVHRFKNTTDLFRFIDDNAVQFVDFNFTDLRGKWHHITYQASALSKETMDEGVYFDGSSISGWQEIHESDLRLTPDLTKAAIDPFAAQKTLKIFCDVQDPATGRSYTLDPRAIAKKAEQHIAQSGIADTAYFGPEAEFFIFDDVRVHSDSHKSGYEIDSLESPHNAGRAYPQGNSGHRPAVKGGYMPEAPLDSLSDIRAEMLTVMQSMGVPVEKHHHEVAPGQCELGILYEKLTECADNMQLYKYAVHNVANSYGKTATFMPKPVAGENGSGLHVHQSLWRGGKPLFAGDSYAGLSETALYYIGGIIKHARALNAFTNPTTNSYKRLVPGYEAPVLLAFSARNRSAACRIPYGAADSCKRVEIRFPDPSANPYLAFAAMAMAGLDGIANKIHPGKAIEKNLYALPEEERRGIPAVCGSLREALEALQKDYAFLLTGDVFSRSFIDAYISLKMEEVERYDGAIHPVEFKMYYSV